MDRLLPESGEETPGNWYNTDLLDDPEAAELVRQGLEDCAEGRVSPISESDSSGESAAVCRWEVGRWGICGAT